MVNRFQTCLKSPGHAKAGIWLGWLITASVGMAVGGLVGRAGEKPAFNSYVGLDDRSRAAIAAAEVVGMGDPLGALSLVQSGRTYSLWEGLSAPPPAKDNALQKPMAPDPDLVGSGVEDKEPIRSARENRLEAQAYDYTLVLAARTSQEAFANSARKDVTYAHMWEEPHKYRGDVIHIRGRLKRIRRFEAPSAVWQDGVRDIYEGWIFDPDIQGANPVCVVFTELPEGLAVAEKMDRRVTFDGYFFKRYRYEAGDGWHDAPLLIGHTIIPVFAPRPADEESGSIGSQYVSLFLGMISVTVILTVGLAMWYRRGDQRVQARLAVHQGREFVEPGAATDFAGEEWDNSGGPSPVER